MRRMNVLRRCVDLMPKNARGFLLMTFGWIIFGLLVAVAQSGDPLVKSDPQAQDQPAGTLVATNAETLQLNLHKETKQEANGKTQWLESTEKAEWDPAHTALIVVDMWDDHWCKGAAKRVGELAVPMNALIHNARDRGVLIIHAPSTTVDFYKDTPQRKRALDAPFVKTPKPLATIERWGTAWCYPDSKREPEIPIDDTDMGCDCAEKCEIVPPWKRQIATIDIEEPDAITDNGQELWNLLEQHKIDHVLIMGVHLNMCVLGRPFAIRQLVTMGKEVVLIRDMTDTMYNHEKRPFVDHFTGTDLMLRHVERFWCPTIQSTDLVGGKPFRFKEDNRENVGVQQSE